MGSSLSSIYPLLTKPSHTDISFPKTHSVPSSLGAFVLLRPLLGIPAPLQLLAQWQLLIMWFKEKISVADMACPFFLQCTYHNNLIFCLLDVAGRI